MGFCWPADLLSNEHYWEKKNICVAHYPTVKAFELSYCGIWLTVSPFLQSQQRQAQTVFQGGQRDERHTHKASSQTRTMQSARKASMGYTNWCASLPPCSHFYGDTFTPGTAVTLKHNGLFIEAGGPFSTSRGRRESLNAGNRRHDGLSEQSIAMDLHAWGWVHFEWGCFHLQLKCNKKSINQCW